MNDEVLELLRLGQALLPDTAFFRLRTMPSDVEVLILDTQLPSDRVLVFGCWCLVSEIPTFPEKFSGMESVWLVTPARSPCTWSAGSSRLSPPAGGKASTLSWNINASLWLLFHVSISRVKADGSLRERERERERERAPPWGSFAVRACR